MAQKSKEDKKIEVHLLTYDPERCYQEECKKDRFADVREEQQKKLKKSSKKDPNFIRFVCISDTHNADQIEQLHKRIPDGDVLIHAGDFLGHSDHFAKEIVKFNNFLEQIKDRFKHIVVIGGNHEISFCDKTWNKYRLPKYLTPTESRDMLMNCTYIQDEGIELYGIKIYGSPWQPVHYENAFTAVRGEALLRIWEMIPSDTDILITHGPPLGIGDITRREMHAGCAELMITVMDRVKPKFHVFGHIHEAHGIWRNDTTVFINASTCDRSYQLVNDPIVFDYEVPVSPEA